MIRGYSMYRCVERSTKAQFVRHFGKARQQKVVHKTPQQMKQEVERRKKNAESKKLEAKMQMDQEREEYEESLRRFVPDAFYQGIPFKVPDIRRLFSEEDVKEAVDAIDNDDESDFEKHPYRIFVAMMLERPPVVKPTFDHIDQYKNALTQLKLNQNNMPPLIFEMYQEKLNLREKEKEQSLNKFPLTTKDDETNNYHSLERCLQQRLYFICKRKGQQYYEFPWTERSKDETLNDTARRALYSRATSGNIRYFHTSLGPVGHNQIEYSEENQKKTGKKGAQVFFQRCFWISGNAREHSKPEDIEEYAWVTRDELPNHLNPILWSSLDELVEH